MHHSREMSAAIAQIDLDPLATVDEERKPGRPRPSRASQASSRSSRVSATAGSVSVTWAGPTQASAAPRACRRPQHLHRTRRGELLERVGGLRMREPELVERLLVHEVRPLGAVVVHELDVLHLGSTRANSRRRERCDPPPRPSRAPSASSARTRRPCLLPRAGTRRCATPSRRVRRACRSGTRSSSRLGHRARLQRRPMSCLRRR